MEYPADMFIHGAQTGRAWEYVFCKIDEATQFEIDEKYFHLTNPSHAPEGLHTPGNCLG